MSGEDALEHLRGAEPEKPVGGKQQREGSETAHHVAGMRTSIAKWRAANQKATSSKAYAAAAAAITRWSALPEDGTIAVLASMVLANLIFPCCDP